MKQTTICLSCGTSGTVEVDNFAASVFSFPERPFPWYCPECKSKRDAVKTEGDKKRKEQEEREYLDSAFDRAGLPKKYRVEVPPVKCLADWMIKHANENQFVNGQTGTGKSTSAGFLVRKMIEAGESVRYLQMSQLLDKWREARCGDSFTSAEDMISGLESVDRLIIDEASGDKTVISGSTKECMFRLLEDIYNGECKAKVSLLGNFYRGCIDDVFGNESAARRRLSESFVCININPEHKITKIKL